MSTKLPPQSWLNYKAAIAKRFGFAPPKPRFRFGHTPTGADVDGWTRHMLYFCYPLQGGSWRHSLDQLKRRLDLFNGERWIAIATPTKRPGHVCDDAKTVIDYFGATNANYVVLNHPARKLGEVLAFTTLWEQVQKHRGPRDVTFYAHTKGVTKPVHPTISVHRWGDVMYAANLDHWPDVAKLLESHCTVGAFKKTGWFRGDTRFIKWHYHGTFFWARNADVFKRDWRTVRQRYGGTEMWPGTMFADDESACIFYGGNDVNGYDVQEMKRAELCLRLWPWPTRTMVKPEMISAMREFMESLYA